MKRILLVLVVLAIFAVPAFAQVRLDIGADIPLALGLLSGGSLSGVSETAEVLAGHIFPFPEAGVYYNWDFGMVKLGAGARFFTFILQTVFWPNVIADVVVLDRVFIEGQLGGLIFGAFGLLNSIDAGQVLIPDLSVWVGLGKEKRFRLGGGAMGLMAPEISGNEMLMIFYLGGKVSLLF